MHHKVRLHIHQKMTEGQTPAAIPHSQRGGAHSSCYSFLGWHPLGSHRTREKATCNMHLLLSETPRGSL